LFWLDADWDAGEGSHVDGLVVAVLTVGSNVVELKLVREARLEFNRDRGGSEGKKSGDGGLIGLVRESILSVDKNHRSKWQP